MHLKLLYLCGLNYYYQGHNSKCSSTYILVRRVTYSELHVFVMCLEKLYLSYSVQRFYKRFVLADSTNGHKTKDDIDQRESGDEFEIPVGL